ncbi:hypothetical protein [Sulfurirhabdus autotrophica]|uniref:Uncharacterized protein n=1 Tax=Sulfurirhabdus autotrophica TaxID=1706046 RepID=A0A4R3XS75_9PROT|nr:hypothetical protein [Sulfurirhabdus autotrophica]TCV81086.1 hypothetical protein EDC63_1264 [Sulfurirhabdus autotrophica]
MLKKYSFLILSAFLCFIFIANAKDVTSNTKKKLPIECTDHDNFDMTDCEKARQLEQWVRDQEKVPDDKRFLSAMMGEDLLIEKFSGFRIGLHKIQIAVIKDMVTSVKIGVPNVTGMYAMGAANGCDIISSIDILNNTEYFTFFRWECQSTKKNGAREKRYDYYNYDKHYRRLDNVISSSYQKIYPSLTYTKGTYKFQWLNYKQSDGTPNPIFYNFKISGNRPADLKCGRTWNDECDITMIAPIPQNQYKILDE